MALAGRTRLRGLETRDGTTKEPTPHQVIRGRETNRKDAKSAKDASFYWGFGLQGVEKSFS
jgi:hypothetical protein